MLFGYSVVVKRLAAGPLCTDLKAGKVHTSCFRILCGVSGCPIQGHAHAACCVALGSVGCPLVESYGGYLCGCSGYVVRVVRGVRMWRWLVGVVGIAGIVGIVGLRVCLLL
jgi:hypothetical protein